MCYHHQHHQRVPIRFVVLLLLGRPGTILIIITLSPSTTILLFLLLDQISHLSARNGTSSSTAVTHRVLFPTKHPPGSLVLHPTRNHHCLLLLGEKVLQVPVERIRGRPVGFLQTILLFPNLSPSRPWSLGGGPCFRSKSSGSTHSPVHTSTRGHYPLLLDYPSCPTCCNNFNKRNEAHTSVHKGATAARGECTSTTMMVRGRSRSVPQTRMIPTTTTTLIVWTVLGSGSCPVWTQPCSRRVWGMKKIP